MSCWRKTTVLRVPAIHLGFVYRSEWKQFLDEHDEEFDWSPGHFSSALCDDYSYEDYFERIKGKISHDSSERLDLGLYPGVLKSVPGPFLDYYIEEISPLTSEDRKYGADNCARPLTQEEKEKYLPLYRMLFPDFTIEKMEKIHYCRYEWYDGAEAQYFY